MKHYSITLIILLLSFVTFQCQNSPVKTDKKPLPAEVVATIEKRIEEGVTPSIALAIIDSSGVQYFNFGKTATNGKDVDEYTIYEIGLYQLLQRYCLHNKCWIDIQLEDKVNDFLPDGITIPVSGDTEITFGNLTIIPLVFKNA
ncbi:MAG: hypothetical protein R2804_08805 [Cyclobacteriaceae bacterium]